MCKTFSVLSGDLFTAPSLPTGPMPKELQPPGTTNSVVITGFLLPLEPQSPLPDGYPADYVNSLASCTLH